jgi:hypothetical protein
MILRIRETVSDGARSVAAFITVLSAGVTIGRTALEVWDWFLSINIVW